MNKLYGKCGHECSRCLVFNATQKGSKAEKIEAAKAINTVLDRNYKWNEIHCNGCRSSDSEILHISKNCPVRKCKTSVKLRHCSKCANYPCIKLKENQSILQFECEEVRSTISNDLYELVCGAYDNSSNNLKMIEYSKNIRSLALQEGAHIIGFAETLDIKNTYIDITIPANLLDLYQSAISIGVEIPSEIIRNIINKPTKDYSSSISQINDTLNTVAESISKHLIKSKYKAMIIQASETLDWKQYKGAISHKAVAYWAGLGWIGKNNLLITPQYGSRIRLITVFTNAILHKDSPIKKNCKNCKKCIEHCPAKAIKDIQFLKSNAKQLDVFKCANYIKNKFADYYIKPYVCGLCIKNCPYSI